MKKLVVLFLVGIFSVSMMAQEKKNKNKSITFKVNGNCEMCEKRIEKAAFSIKGVKSADWHSDHQDIHLIFDENKCTAKDVAKAIALVGYDNQFYKTTDKLYEELHGCCQYERAE